MADPQDIDVSVKALSETLAPYAHTIQRNPDSTIEPRSGGMDTDARQAIDLLGRLAGDNSDHAGKLELGETLGEGGMGIVRLAIQRVMGRQVAVKTLRPEHVKRGRATLKLLREGWITGALEHPNVVPVYDIGLDDLGVPLIVLKRIEGTHWGALMGNAELVQERFGVTSLLEWNLRTLMQVCNAVSFAHSRGIVHRDLKPENVMIGEFGEVYVVDWGLAVSLTDDGSGRFPLATNSTDMVGTPSYMAPEMLGGVAASEQTDVYLLGAVLYRILTGQPPHRGRSMNAIIQSVLQSDPKLPPALPGELQEICRHAMAPAPTERYASADRLRVAIQDYLQHRGSHALAREARRRLGQLLELTQRARDSDREDSDLRRKLYNLYAECKFGFRQALGAWPECPDAHEGLRTAGEAMVEYEIAQDDPRAAAVPLADLADPPAELRQRVERAAQTKAHQQARLEQDARVGRDMDPDGLGRHVRMFVAAAIGVLWTLLPLLLAIFVQDTPRESYRNFIAGAVGVLVVLALPIAIWARQPLMATAINRRLACAVALVLVGDILLLLGGLHLGLPMPVTVAWVISLWAGVSTMCAVGMDWRLFPLALSMTLAAMAMIIWPETRYYAVACSDLVLTINVLVIWRDDPRFDQAF